MAPSFACETNPVSAASSCIVNNKKAAGGGHTQKMFNICVNQTFWIPDGGKTGELQRAAHIMQYKLLILAQLITLPIK